MCWMVYFNNIVVLTADTTIKFLALFTKLCSQITVVLKIAFIVCVKQLFCR